jgi:hypothetical protein
MLWDVLFICVRVSTARAALEETNGNAGEGKVTLLRLTDGSDALS